MVKRAHQTQYLVYNSAEGSQRMKLTTAIAIALAMGGATFRPPDTWLSY